VSVHLLEKWRHSSVRKHYCAFRLGLELGLGSVLAGIWYVFGQTCFRASVGDPASSLCCSLSFLKHANRNVLYILKIRSRTCIFVFRIVNRTSTFHKSAGLNEMDYYEPHPSPSRRPRSESPISFSQGVLSWQSKWLVLPTMRSYLCWTK